MTTHSLLVEVHARRVGPTVADLREEVNQIMDELIAIEDEQVHDAALGLTLQDEGDAALLEFDLNVTADTIDDAIQLGLTRIRAAIHAAGGATPGWGTEPEPTDPDFAALLDGFHNRSERLVDC